MRTRVEVKQVGSSNYEQVQQPGCLPNFQVDRWGWVRRARQIRSPFCDARPAHLAPTLVVIHAISLPAGSYGGPDVERLFTRGLDGSRHPAYGELQGLEVSAHFVVRRTGALWQFVPCASRAWHAGVSCWRGRARCNDWSIGIELEGCDSDSFTVAQYQSLDALLLGLMERYPLRDLAGHCHIAPARKTDPGPYFDWQGLQARFPQLRGPHSSFHSPLSEVGCMS